MIDQLQADADVGGVPAAQASEYPAALPVPPPPLQREVVQTSPTDAEILEFLDGLLEGFREAAARGTQSTTQGCKVSSVPGPSQVATSPWGIVEPSTAMEDVPRQSRAAPRPGNSGMPQTGGFGKSPWDIDDLSRTLSPQFPQQQQQRLGMHSSAHPQREVLPQQLLGPRASGVVPIGAARTLPSPPAPCGGHDGGRPWQEARPASAQSMPSVMRRQALREFLEEQFGTVARAFDQMTQQSIGSKGLKEDRMRHAFAADEFRQTLSLLGYGAHSSASWWNQLFVSIDVDGDGYVSLEDMYHALVLDELSSCA
mmetsp:Transcript_13943/g.25733  ORF Transcript_13943/g.25733 Transcript_13943/m.25733 type:complete len:312 (+) Transcript_13943:93-1028(+)